MSGRTGAAQVAAFGAQRQHVTLPTGFRSPSKNSHSRYGYLTVRFAPKTTSVITLTDGKIGRKADLRMPRLARPLFDPLLTLQTAN